MFSLVLVPRSGDLIFVCASLIMLDNEARLKIEADLYCRL